MSDIKHYSWRWVHHNGKIFNRTWIKADGSLHNPNNYPEEEARAAALEADERRHQKLIEARKRGVETAKRRREERIAKITRDFLLGKHIGNLQRCACCGKTLTDPISIERGIGSECWPRLMDRLAEAVPTCERHLEAVQRRLKECREMTFDGWVEKHGYTRAYLAGTYEMRYRARYCRDKEELVRMYERDVADTELLLAAARRWKGPLAEGLEQPQAEEVRP